MDIRSPLFKNIAAAVAGVLFINPVVALGANLALDNAAGGNTTLGQAGNGVPIVNIATPSGSGLSHNKFNEYNVGQQGLILNNATGATNSTQLGGIILGNPNLANGAAGVILNEVTGVNPTNLRGYTEVAGQRAGVIVANPHGITCDGCGFINTPRVTLSTGKPVVEQGALKHFDVEGGAISIQGAGLNATNVDRFDLITRSAQINANLHANQLNIVTGRNLVDATTLEATAKTGESSDKPMLALDSSALGGMYAGAIRLIGTEQGVGVRLAGDMAAHAGDIHIDANGQLSLGRTATAGNLNLSAQGVALSADTYAAGNANIQAQGDLTNQQNLTAAGDVTLAGSTVDNQGSIQGRTANIVASKLDNRQGLVDADKVVIKTGQIDNRQGLINADKVNIQAAQIDNRTGRIIADQNLTLESTNLNNESGLVQSRGDARLSAEATLNNRAGDIIALGDLALSAGVLDNSAQGLVATLGEAALAVGSLDNRGGEINTAKNLNLTATQLDNSQAGRIIAQGKVAIDSNNTNNQSGLVSGREGINFKGGSLDNSQGGTLSSREGGLAVNLEGALDNSQQGALVSTGDQRITAGSLDNSQEGIVSSEGAVELHIAGRLDNEDEGLISATTALAITADTVQNRAGKIGAGGELLLNARNLDNSVGQFTSAGAMTLALTGNLLNRQGQLVGTGPVRIDAQHLDNHSGYLASQNLLNIFGVSLLNAGGTLAARNDLAVDLAGTFDNSADGLMFSQSGALNVNAGEINNRDGALQSQGELSLNAGGAISNQGGRIIAQQGDVNITAASVDNSESGIINSVAGWLRSATSGLFNNQSGTTQAQQVDLNVGQLNNAGGHLSALGGNLVVTGGTIDNQAGGLFARDLLSLNAASLDNRTGRIGAKDVDFSLAGALANNHGLIESSNSVNLSAAAINNQQGVVRALGRDGNTAIQTRTGALDNRSGLIETASENVTLTLAGLMNDAGTVRHVGNGLFDISSANATQAGGSLITNGALNLSATQWVHSGLLQAARLTLNVGNFTQTDSGRLLATDSLTATGGNWTNHGLIASDGAMSLSLTGTYSGNGKLVSLGNLELNAHNVLLANSATVLGGAGAIIRTTGELNNRGRVTSVGDMTLQSAVLNNYGTLGGASAVRITATSFTNDHGLVFSGGDMSLRGSDLLNRRGDFYSLGSLSYAANDDGHQAYRFRNLSGTVESAGGMYLAANVLENARETFDISTEKVSANLTDLRCGNCGGDKESTYFRLDEIDRTVASNISPLASLLAGSNMQISSGQLNNMYSLIAAGGDLRIDTVTLNNQGAQTGDVTTSREVHAHRVTMSNVRQRKREAEDFSNRNWIESPTYNPTDIIGDINRFITRHAYEVTSLGAPVLSNTVEYNAIIQAGGNVSINAITEINNSVIRPGFAYVSGGNRVGSTAPGTSIATVVTLNPQLPPDLQQRQVNPIALPGFTLPQGENGLFRISGQNGTTANADAGALPAGQSSAIGALNAPAGNHRYLIETNPALTDLKQFLGSDYMLGQLGVDPSLTLMRLGDGLYEQRLVREAVIARTGQRYLAGLTSDEAMYRYLMDNAVASKDALQLSLGVALTAEQVAALTHDIVWMEEHEVMGQRVLVPVLYLAQAEGRLAANGALIQGQDVSLISGGNLNNQGTLRATQNLSLQADNISNSGLMQAHERIQLIATDSIRNAAGGIIAGRDVTAIAINGDIINERSVNTHQSGRGDSFQHRQDIVDSAARIEAGNDLLLSAGRDILNIGGSLSAGGDAALLAGRDLLIASQQEQSAMAQTGRRSTTTQQSVTQLASDVQVGGDLSLGAGRDIAIIASTVAAGGNMALKAEGDITIAAAANESHFEHHRKGGGKQVDIERTSIVQQGAELSAGGNFISQSGGDTTLISSNIAAGQQAYLYTGGNLNLLAAQDVEYDLYDKKEKGSFGRRETRRDEVTDVRHVGSSVTAGGDLSLISEGDQLYQNARLQSGNDLTLDAGGAITFEAVKDLHQESHERSKSDWAWNAAKGKGTTDETLVQSQLIAQGNLAIRAAEGIQIDIKEIDQNTVSQTIDAMVQADPDLAWLKQMEAQGDIDWRTVKEIHDSFDYSHSGLGVGAQLIVAIVVSYLTAGATSAALNSMASASAGSGSVMASAGSTAMVNAGTAVGTAAAGWGNVAATAAITSAASNAAVSTINNRGDLGAVFKDVTSSDAMKNYAVGGITAGVTSGVLDKTFGVTGDNINKVTKGFDLSSATDIGKFGMYLGAQGATQAAVSTAVYGGSLSDNLSGALTAQGQHLLQAVMFNWVGDVSEGRWDEGSPQKIAFHALVGGMLSEATGGDFATGAAAAGASEALIERLSGVIKGDKSLELVSAQMIGIIAAAAVDGDVTKGAEIARNATAYNRQLHPDEVKRIKNQAGKLAAEQGITPAEAERLLAQAHAYFVDEQFRETLEANGVTFDESTLRHLSVALSPIADRYDYVRALGDVPLVQDPNRVYTPQETLGLLQQYHQTHQGSFENPLMYSEYLVGWSPTALEQRKFYEETLNFRTQPGWLSTSSAAVAGSDAALTAAAKDIYHLAVGLVQDFAGTSEQIALGLVTAAGRPDQIVGDFLQAKQDAEAQAYLYDLQGKPDLAAYTRANWETEFALNVAMVGRARVGGLPDNARVGTGGSGPPVSG